MPIWTAEDVEALRKLWRGGFGVTEISLRLGKSRNAVIGKAHRLELGIHRSLLPNDSDEWTRLICEDYFQSRSLNKTGKRFGIHYTTVRYHVIKAGEFLYPKGYRKAA